MKRILCMNFINLNYSFLDQRFSRQKG